MNTPPPEPSPRARWPVFIAGLIPGFIAGVGFWYAAGPLLLRPEPVVAAVVPEKPAKGKARAKRARAVPKRTLKAAAPPAEGGAAPLAPLQNLSHLVYDGDNLETAVIKQAPMLHGCIERGAQADEVFAGDFTLSFNVWTDGSIRDLKANGWPSAPEALMSCVAAQLKRMRLPFDETQSNYIELPFSVSR